MPITSHDLHAALAAAGLPADDYDLSDEGARLLRLPNTSLDQTHVRLTVAPHLFERLRSDGWEEVAAGYLGRGILLARAARPRDRGSDQGGSDPLAEHEPAAYSSALTFANRALLRPREAAREVGGTIFFGAAWFVLAVTAVLSALTTADTDVLAVLLTALVGAPLLLLLGTGVLWVVRRLCGGRGRTPGTTMMQIVVATAWPTVLGSVARLVLGLPGAVVQLALTVWAVVILVQVIAAAFRVGALRATVTYVGSLLALGAVLVGLSALLTSLI